jgi:purine-nucleoside phosphorylase
LVEAAPVLGNDEAVAFLDGRGFSGPRVGFVLGSGWGHFVESTEVLAACPFGDVPGFGASTVPGHAGRLVRGRAAGGEYLAMQGRLHRYEGHPLRRIGNAVAVLRGLGVRELVVTCAAGAVNPEYRVGDLVAVGDFINFMLESPARGMRAPAGTRRAVSPRLTALAAAAAEDAGIPLRRGVLFASKGPSYETPAEVRMVRGLGGDVVSMSTAPEILAADALGMEAAAFACVTNMAPGVLPGAAITHDEVIEVMQAGKARFSRLLSAVLAAFERARGDRPGAGRRG